MRREAPPPSPDGRAGAAAKASADAARYAGAAPPSLYGFVFCRTRRDAAARRGAVTRSVVVLADAPRSSALRPLAAAAAAAFFADGPPGLAAAYAATLDWPAPDPDEPACVEAGGGASWVAAAAAPRVLPPPADDESDSSRHPCAPLPPLATAAGAPAPHGAFHEADIYSPFAALAPHLWTLWEATVTATPTLVLSRDPGTVSGAVAALVAAAAPLPYAADFRPFLQVHDTQAAALASASGAPARADGLPRLVGATSPFFARELGGWPLVARLGCGVAAPASAAAAPPSPPPASRFRRAAAAVAGGAGAALGAAAALVPRARDRGLSSLEGPDALFLSPAFKPTARPDRALLRRLARVDAAAAGGGAAAAARAAASNSAALRFSLLQLTEAVLSLFTPYWEPVPVPPGFGPLPARAPPPRPPLSHAAFLDSLPPAARMPEPLLATFGSRSGVVSFYRRFLASPNFASWFGRAAARARAWQAREWAAAAESRGVVAAARPAEAPKGGGDAEMVDVWLTAAAAAAAAAAGGAPDADALADAALAALDAMPADLRAAVTSSPTRAASARAAPSPVPRRPSFPGVVRRRSASAGGSSDGGPE